MDIRAAFKPVDCSIIETELIKISVKKPWTMSVCVVLDFFIRIFTAPFHYLVTCLQFTVCSGKQSDECEV